MNVSTWWWIAAGAAVVIELLSGTFYLLMFALGLVAGALTAWLGGSWALQLVAAAVVGGGAVALWHVYRSRGAARPAPPRENPDLLLDIGQPVHVGHWHANGTARVQYRGAQWSARHEGGAAAAPRPGEYLIRAVDGSELVLGPR